MMKFLRTWFPAMFAVRESRTPIVQIKPNVVAVKVPLSRFNKARTIDDQPAP